MMEAAAAHALQIGETASEFAESVTSEFLLLESKRSAPMCAYCATK
jgi:hypothetical protein